MRKVTEFEKRVYFLCSLIPKGKVSTYGVLAKELKSSPRAVGQALKKNPYAPKVPCHRVVCANGNIGGFMGCVKGKEIENKITLLSKESVKVENSRIVDFQNKNYKLSYKSRIILN